MASSLARDLRLDSELWRVEGITSMRKRIFDLVCTLYEEQEVEKPKAPEVHNSPISSPLPKPSSLSMASPWSRSSSTAAPNSDSDDDVTADEKEDSPGEQLVKESNTDTDDTKLVAQAAESKPEPEMVKMAEKPKRGSDRDRWKAVRSS